MALRDRLRDAARFATGLAGEALTGLAQSTLFKGPNPLSDDDDGTTSDDGADTTPGGAKADSALTAPVPTDKAGKDPKTLFWDPFAIVEQLGYKDKPSPITYQTLKQMCWKMPIVHAVIQLRINQIASASQPVRDRYQFGWRLKLRDTNAKPTPQDKKWMEQAEALIMRTGVTDNPRGRDSFETFLRKSAFDTLVLDQMCWEIVPNRKGQPAEWYAVDGSTIRLADTGKTTMNEDDDKAIRYVQIYDAMVIAEYTQEEMLFAVRNPRTDIRLYGYGTSELEMLVPSITSLLWAWEYNSRFFSQGSAAKGIINFKGAVPENQLKNFRRHWYQMLSGVENAFRTPITNAEELQFINMQTSNRDMEFSNFMDFLIKTVCSMYQMDPIEVNFKYGNSGQKSGMNEANNKEKIMESRERGLRPLLRFIAQNMNKSIIWPMNENFEFEFVGLDAKTRDEVADYNAKRVKATMMIDELRAEDDLPPLPDGAGQVILDPTWMAAMTMKMQQSQQDEQEKKQAEQLEQMTAGQPDFDPHTGMLPDYAKLGGPPGAPGAAPGMPPKPGMPGLPKPGGGANPFAKPSPAPAFTGQQGTQQGADQPAAPAQPAKPQGAQQQKGLPGPQAGGKPFGKSFTPVKKPRIVDVRF